MRIPAARRGFATAIGNPGVDRRGLERLFVALIRGCQHFVGVGDAVAVRVVLAIGLNNLRSLRPVFKFEQRRGAVKVGSGHNIGRGCDFFHPQEMEDRLPQFAVFTGDFALPVDAGCEPFDGLRPFFGPIGHDFQRLDEPLLSLGILLERVVAVRSDRPGTAHQAVVDLAWVADDPLGDVDGLVVTLEFVKVFGGTRGDAQGFTVRRKRLGEAKGTGDCQVKRFRPRRRRLVLGMALKGEDGSMSRLGRAVMLGVVVSRALVFARRLERLAAIEQ